MLIDPVVLATLSLVWAALWTIIGWFANHKLSKARERDIRRRDFVSFVCQWKTEIDQCRQPDIMGEDFAKTVPIFAGKVASIKRDFWFFWRRKRFRQLCNAVISLKAKEVKETGDGQLIGPNKLKAAITRVIEFVD